MMNGWDMSGWGWVWMTLMMLFWTGLIAAVLIALVRGPERGYRSERGESPVEILARRYARGEIDESEYQQRLETLRLLPPHGKAG